MIPGRNEADAYSAGFRHVVDGEVGIGAGNVVLLAQGL